jgi:RNase P/RNase MRP subunit p30
LWYILRITFVKVSDPVLLRSLVEKFKPSIDLNRVSGFKNKDIRKKMKSNPKTAK